MTKGLGNIVLIELNENEVQQKEKAIVELIVTAARRKYMRRKIKSISDRVGEINEGTTID